MYNFWFKWQNTLKIIRSDILNWIFLVLGHRKRKCGGHNFFTIFATKKGIAYFKKDFKKSDIMFPCSHVYAVRISDTLKSQIEGYTHLLFFRKFFILTGVIWAYPFINFHEHFQPPLFFTYTNVFFHPTCWY